MTCFHTAPLVTPLMLSSVSSRARYESNVADYLALPHAFISFILRAQAMRAITLP